MATISPLKKECQWRMDDLLERAGFRIRGRRADCIHCVGHARGTVSFTSAVAYCHRCQWRANIVTLARELGLLAGDSPALRAFREETKRRAAIDAQIRPFELWRDERIREVCARYHSLSRSATHAEEVLREFPGFADEAAWDALARFHHAEAQLSRTFDFLTFAKASAWLEKDSTPSEVFAVWRRHAA
jgi:hypothetical protein